MARSYTHRGQKSMKANFGKSAGKQVSLTKALTDDDKSTILEVRANNAKAIEESMRSAFMVALEEVGLVAEGYAKRLCPVDTGRLRNSITHAIFDEADPYAVIGTNVEYAAAVEYGTSKRKAHPYLHPAAEEHGAEYARIIEARLKG